MKLPLHIRDMMHRLVPQVFTQDTFKDAFIAACDEAKDSIFAYAPFLTSNGFERMISALARAVGRGVRVCIFLEEPEDWYRRDSPTLEPAVRAKLRTLQLNFEALERLQIHVTLRKGLHEKVAVIDYFVCFHGSLNILSWTQQRTESMHRWYNSGLAMEFVRHYKMHECDKCRLLHEPLDPVELLVEPKDIGLILAEQRKARGLTQRELAALAKLDRGTINAIETGKQKPSYETVCNLFAQLDRRFTLLSSAALRLHETIARRSTPRILAIDTQSRTMLKDSRKSPPPTQQTNIPVQSPPPTQQPPPTQRC